MREGNVRMRIIGLTGGIASGKSTVSCILQSFGAVCIDADALAHVLAEPGRALYEAYVAHWGKEILASDGTLNRRKIGAIVFKEDSERKWLNDTAQPILYQAAVQRLNRLKAMGAETVILDAPLLFEAGWDRLADEVWVVSISREEQIRRLMQRDHYSEEEARRRMDAQMSQKEKLRRADVVIDNCGTVEDLKRCVLAAYRKRQVQKQGTCQTRKEKGAGLDDARR